MLRCEICGKGRQVGNNVSHAHNKTRRVQLPNLQWKRVYIPELDRTVRIRLATRALRTIDKKGLLAYLRDQGLKLKDIL